MVTHPSTDRARRCLTTVIGREPVYSTWCGRNRWNALNNLHLYLSEFWSIPSQPATSQVMWRKCIWVNVESTWNKKGCEWLDNDCFSKAWTKHVRGYLQICRRGMPPDWHCLGQETRTSYAVKYTKGNSLENRALVDECPITKYCRE